MKIFEKSKAALIVLAAIILPVLFAVVSPMRVSAQDSIRAGVCDGVVQAGADSCEETDESSFGSLAKKVIDIFSIVVGAISVIMIIIGGFRYIISGGDQNGVTGAKNTIMYAIIGLIIVLFAQVIVRFVLTNTKTS